MYDGYWKDDKRDGRGMKLPKNIGKYTTANGDCYDGDWKEDKKDGRGKNFI